VNNQCFQLGLTLIVRPITRDFAANCSLFTL